MYPFERFSERAKHVLSLAQGEAERSHHSYIGTEHVLLGLAMEEDGLAGQALKHFALQLPDLRATIEEVVGRKEPTVIAQIIPTSRVKRVIEIAFEEAMRENSSTVGTGHLLLALLVEGQGIAAHVLKDRGVTVERLRPEIKRLRDEGVEEPSRAPQASPRHKHVHAEVADTQGRIIAADIVFPADYPDQDCRAVASRVRGAIREDQT